MSEDIGLVTGLRLTAPLALGDGEFLMADGHLITIVDWKFVTSAFVKAHPKAQVITDRRAVRALRRRCRQQERQMRRAQARGTLRNRWTHRLAPHGRHRILVRVGVN